MKRPPMYSWEWTGVHQIITKKFLYARVELMKDLYPIETKELHVPIRLAEKESELWARNRIKELQLKELLTHTSGVSSPD